MTAEEELKRFYEAYGMQQAQSSMLLSIPQQQWNGGTGNLGMLGGLGVLQAETAVPQAQNIRLNNLDAVEFIPAYNRNTINFMRINDFVEISAKKAEDGKFDEPLDELRIKVSRWLNN